MKKSKFNNRLKKDDKCRSVSIVSKKKSFTYEVKYFSGAKR